MHIAVKRVRKSSTDQNSKLYTIQYNTTIQSHYYKESMRKYEI